MKRNYNDGDAPQELKDLSEMKSFQTRTKERNKGK